MLKESALLVREPLLLLTRRDPICTFVSLAFLVYRARRKLYTHIAHVDTLLSPTVSDLLQHYENVLAIDLASELEGSVRQIVDKYGIKLIELSSQSLQELAKVLQRDSNARALLEIACAMFELEYGERPEIEYKQIRELDLPPFPGVNYRPVREALVYSLWPYIPEVTGQEEKARDLLSKLGVDSDRKFEELDGVHVEQILRAIAELLSKHKCVLSVLDKLLAKTYVLPSGALVQDLYLTLEAVYALDAPDLDLASILRLARPLQDKSARGVIQKYLSELRKNLAALLKTGECEVSTLALGLRLGRIARIFRKQFRIRIRVASDTVCYVTSQPQAESYTSRTILRMRDGIVIECVRV